MHLLDARGNHVELDFVGEVPTAGVAARAGVAGAVAGSTALRLAQAASAAFELKPERVVRSAWAKAPSRKAEPPPTVFRERASGLLRMSHRELVIRFRRGTSAAKRDKVLGSHELEIRKRDPFVRDQYVVTDRKLEGPQLIELCNCYVESPDIVFATPNFVSEYRRQASVARPPSAQWHLHNLGNQNGQVKGEDVDALGAWRTTTGRPAVVVAVLDDGVDVEHPNLKRRLWRNPDKAAPDRHGRDFFLPDDHPDHHNPAPKLFNFPYDQMPGNDIHGTPCAGVVAAAGDGAYGVAFGCRVLPVKVFHADSLAQDERVAQAIRYAASNADVLSCSWSGPRSPDIDLAIEDAGRLGRGGLGSPVLCASGNEDGAVAFPAAHPESIAVGASTDAAERAPYSNYGPELNVVAPSSGGTESIFTTDVSTPPGRGFNVGDPARGGADGLHTNEFGGTSSATPLAAGVAALVLSVVPKLTRDQVREVLCESAEKIGGPGEYDANGHSQRLGFGRIDAKRALAAARARGGGVKSR